MVSGYLGLDIIHDLWFHNLVSQMWFQGLFKDEVGSGKFPLTFMLEYNQGNKNYILLKHNKFFEPFLEMEVQ